jgi:hypothetical protein
MLPPVSAVQTYPGDRLGSKPTGASTDPVGPTGALQFSEKAGGGDDSTRVRLRRFVPVTAYTRLVASIAGDEATLCEV